MDSGFSYGDILAIAAVAAFILLRYRAMLGEKTGKDPSEMKLRPMREYDRVVQLTERDSAKTAAAQKPQEAESGPLKETWVAMTALDRGFTPAEFLQGAKAAFEMVIQAFNSADHDTLQMLLSPAIYRDFKETLLRQEAERRKQHTTLIAITEATVDQAELKGAVARLAVRFVSEQVILLRDASGTILEGDPSHQQVVEDHWVFERTMTAGDPAWKIVET